MVEGNFVDRAVRRAQDDVHVQAMRYPVQPERMTDAESEAWQVGKLYARIVAAEQKIIDLGQRVNALEMLLADETAKHVAYEEELAHLRQYELPAEARWHRELLTGELVPDTDDEPEMDDNEPVEETR